MARQGLDENGRKHIASLIEAQRSGDYVRSAIDHRIRSSAWDYDKNVEFLRWMRRKGYNDTAEHLARYLDG